MSRQRYREDPEFRRRKLVDNATWAQENPEKRRDHTYRWRERNPGKWRDYENEWGRLNRDKTRGYERARLAKDPARRRGRNRKRRALKKSQLGLWDDDRFIESQLWLYQSGNCFYCGIGISHPSLPERDFHLEHCTPLSRGGFHCASNVVLACKDCNLGKGTKTAEEFTRREIS